MVSEFLLPAFLRVLVLFGSVLLAVGLLELPLALPVPPSLALPEPPALLVRELVAVPASLALLVLGLLALVALPVFAPVAVPVPVPLAVLAAASSLALVAPAGVVAAEPVSVRLRMGTVWRNPVPRRPPMDGLAGTASLASALPVVGESLVACWVPA